MNILIPMAGDGSRFIKQGVSTPKPLIQVNGRPMIINALKYLPVSSKQIFICRSFHKKVYNIDKELRKYYPNSVILYIDELTEGQATTCLLAKDYINSEEELFIGASDNGMIYKRDNFLNAKVDCDCLVFTFRNNVTVNNIPEQYGWVLTDLNNKIIKVSVKVPISDYPVNDHAIVGAFWFKKGSDFVKGAEDMIIKNQRINNEFYVDECINNLIQMGIKANVFEVDYYVCWGTPVDLKTFEYWEGFFSVFQSGFCLNKTK